MNERIINLKRAGEALWSKAKSKTGENIDKNITKCTKIVTDSSKIHA